MSFPRLCSAALLAGLLLALPAAAQLDLPKASPSSKPKPSAAEPKKTGAETKHGYVDPEAPPMPGSSQPKRPKKAQREDLSLQKPGVGPTGGAPSPESVAPEAAAAPTGATSVGPAAFIYEELHRTEDPKASLVHSAERSLVDLGVGALDASRAALAGEQVVPLVVSARVLLAVGTELDREAVLSRVRRPLPRRAVAPLLAAVAELGGERATDAYFADLLDHGQSPVRVEAERILQKRLAPEILPSLLTALRSERDDTRLRALSLASGVQDPSVMHLLLDSLSDSSATVAFRAVQALAVLEDERVEDVLLTRATGQPLVLRAGAYALLALVVREDRLGVSILGDEHVPHLLDNMQVSQPLVAGACACALAGIGFRSETPAETPWLDRDVPHQLVRAVSAAVYHRDFSSVRDVAERRLALIAGQSFGSDGPAWQRWWVEHEADFQARRAHLSVGQDDALRIALHYRSVIDRDDFRLLGPAVGIAASSTADVVSAGGGTEVFHLSAAECADLVGLLRREGVFGGERLPGVRGASGIGARELEVKIGGQGKTFVIGEGIQVPWFERAVEMGLALRERNRWQRYPDPTRHANRRELWEAERDWWAEDRSEVERDRRLKDLILASLPTSAYQVRDRGVEQLQALYAKPDVAGPADFAPLLEILRAEPFFGPRTRRISGLVRRAALEASATSSDGAAEGAGGEVVLIDPSLAREVKEVLLIGFGTDGSDELVNLLAQTDPALAREAAADSQPFVRALAADALARHPEGENLTALMKLLEDRNEEVEAVAVLALGNARVEEARTELLVRARVGDPVVRAAALRAIGHLGGPEVKDPLLLGLADGDPMLRVAATEGLAALADPDSAEILVSVLLQGRASMLFEPARRGLTAIGEPAWPLLLRAANTGRPDTRREATLLLSEQGVAEAASSLITIFTNDAEDERAADELAVLTCQDFRGKPDPAKSWWAWWDTVPHDDSLAWVVRAGEELGLAAPKAAALAGEGTQAGADFLLQFAAKGAPHQRERARRELARVLAREVPAVPEHLGQARTDWVADVRGWIQARWSR